jgi:membrane-associated protease RseP (regulator of RpoE activity)
MVLRLGTWIVVSTLALAQSVDAQGRARGGAGGSTDASGRGGLAIGYSRRPVLYGFALECVDCQPMGRGRANTGGVGSFSRADGSSATYALMYIYTSFPRVAAVLPNSIAEAAGIRVGDVLTSIDGLSLLTEEGSRRFASAASGDEVRLTFDRASKLIDVPLVLGQVKAGGAQQMISVGQLSARYSGAFGNVDIDIWSDDAVNVSRDSTGAMLLRAGTTLIRIRADSTGTSFRRLMTDSVAGGRGGVRGRGRGGPPID